MLVKERPSGAVEKAQSGSEEARGSLSWLSLIGEVLDHRCANDTSITITVTESPCLFKNKISVKEHLFS